MTALSSHKDWNHIKYAARRSKSHQATLHKDQYHAKLYCTLLFFCTPVTELRAELIQEFFKGHLRIVARPFLGNLRVAILRFTIYMTQQCQWSCPDTSWQAPDRATVRYTGNPTKTKFTSHKINAYNFLNEQYCSTDQILQFIQIIFEKDEIPLQSS